jgi:UDP-2,4-diacetamido-2,4,6-trideoxy-beta-L-altropyranose hydrolase
MPSILIRCDASLSIGSGHVVRCRTLARELQRRGSEVRFLCRRQPGDLITLLEPEFEVLALPEQPLAAWDGLTGRELYTNLLGCSQHQDAVQCLGVLAEASITSATWLVVDHYGLDDHWQAQMLEGLADADQVPKLLVIDDLADRPHIADLLLDQNFFGEATNQRYRDLVPPVCLQLLGPHYALLGPEYAQLHPLMHQRTELRRVLVFFGGVDPDNLTGRALEALMDPAFAHLAVDVVLGLQSPHRQAIAEIVACRPFTTLHGPTQSLAGLIARADLAIGAGGATTWERVCLKLPSLVVTVAANQLPFSEALDQSGYLELLGNGATVTVEQIRYALLTRMTEPKPGEVSPALTDGWGAARLAMAMLGPQGEINLRPAIAADEALFLNWANHLHLYTNTVFHDSFAPKDHHHWIKTVLIDPNHFLLIAITAEGCPIGQISFHRHSTCIPSDASEAAVDITLDPCALCHGMPPALVRLGLQAMEQRWGGASEAAPEEYSSYTDSSRCFVRAGFPPNSEHLSEPHYALSACESLALPPGRITLLSDRASWLNVWLPELVGELWQRGHAVRWIHSPSALCPGDVCLLLSCGRLLNPAQLSLHRYNLVVHESALPKGQGWSPMTWQILQGASSIPITLFEAVADLDAGPIHLQQQITLQGHELVDEWRSLQARATIDLCLTWFDHYKDIVSAVQPQQGEATHFRRRKPVDSVIDPTLSLTDQFNLLRIVDNSKYPAHFWINGRKYTITIT